MLYDNRDYVTNFIVEKPQYGSGRNFWYKTIRYNNFKKGLQGTKNVQIKNVSF